MFSSRLTLFRSLGGGNADADAYIAAAGITDSAFKARLRTFFTATAGVRAKLDVLYLWANQSATAARTDLITPTRALLTLSKLSGYFDNGMGGEDYYEASPLFTQWRGYSQQTLDGSSYTSISGPLNGSTAKFNATPAVKGASAFAYFNSLVTTTNNFVVLAGGSLTSYFTLTNLNNQIQAAINGQQAGAYVPAMPKNGFISASAIAGTYRFSRHGVYQGGNTVTQQPTPGLTGMNFGSTDSTNGRLAAVGFGEALTDSETASFYDALQTLLTSIGAQV